MPISDVSPQGASMTPAAARQPGRAVAVALGALAVIGIASYLLLDTDSRTLDLASEAMVAIAAYISALVIQSWTNRGQAWAGSRHLATTMLLIGIGTTVFFISELITPTGTSGPRTADLVFLGVVVPLVLALRDEFRLHFVEDERVEIGADATLIVASLTAILYLILRPIDATGQIAASAAVFALLGATMIGGFGALLLWSPGMVHVVQFGILAALGLATLEFGWSWTHGMVDSSSPAIVLPLFLCPLALAATVVLFPPPGDLEPQRLARWARPLLTSIAVLAACGALGAVALFDEQRALGGAQSAAIVALLIVGIAGRIVANQMSSTRAQQEVRAALAQKEAALREADDALEQVRAANETLRRSQEHLRLVFDAAVDGIVELDEDDRIVRTNEAFGRMVGFEVEQIEGQPWTTVAASVLGADATFEALLQGGQAELQRTEGQPLFLESRISTIPADPPRRLLMIRDVTAAKVADQTIRSLFQFLQDRDEDRTRLLRRTNAAIEAERNRMARDLHDGPVQGVSAASLSLEAALLMLKAGELERGMEVLGKIREELASEADALRGLMSGLRPPVLEERGLVAALRDTLVRFGAERGVATEFAGRIDRPVATDLETLAFRVVQEALSNTGKHAHADQVLVSVITEDDQLRIEVEDDGRGFDAGQTREFLKQGRVGLASMRERVELASGTFTIRSSPGRGTSVVAVLPLDVEIVPTEPVARDRV